MSIQSTQFKVWDRSWLDSWTSLWHCRPLKKDSRSQTACVDVLSQFCDLNRLYYSLNVAIFCKPVTKGTLPRTTLTTVSSTMCCLLSRMLRCHCHVWSWHLCCYSLFFPVWIFLVTCWYWWPPRIMVWGYNRPLPRAPEELPPEACCPWWLPQGFCGRSSMCGLFAVAWKWHKKTVCLTYCHSFAPQLPLCVCLSILSVCHIHTTSQTLAWETGGHVESYQTAMPRCLAQG